MAYEVAYARGALKQLKKLERTIARRIMDYMDDVGGLDDPRARGKGLKGELHGIWRYRVGDYRVLCRIQDGELVVLVLDAAHRGKVYD